jgi:hypothetical protein
MTQRLALPADDDDYEIVNGKKIVKDGRHVRVPMHMMDGIQHGVAAHFGRVTDAAGGSEGLGRPGFRLNAAHDAAARRRLYDQYDEDIGQQWKNPPQMHFAGEGDVCTVRGPEYPDDEGSPGHLRRIKGKLVCVPDDNNNKTDALRARTPARAYAKPAEDHKLTMDELYRSLDRDLENAWRGK